MVGVNAVSLQTFDSWLGIRKCIWPVKKFSVEVLAWLSAWSEMQMICICSS